MNFDEQEMYASFIMGMRKRGRQEKSDAKGHTPENQAAEELYGEKYAAIRDDFADRVDERLLRGETFK